MFTVQGTGTNVLSWSCGCHRCVWYYTRGDFISL